MAVQRRLRNASRNATSAIRGRRARKAARTREDRELVRGPVADQIDRRLSALAAKVLAGHHVEFAWELFRLQHFPGWDHEEVAAALGAWSRRHGLKVTFEGRTVRDASAATSLPTGPLIRGGRFAEP
jgi:hypothetical protein